MGPPWVFPYVAEPGREDVYQPPALRPAVAISLATVERAEETPKFLALVDSGSERTLAGPGLGRVATMQRGRSAEMQIKLGGAPRTVRFGVVTLRLYRNVWSVDEAPLDEWNAEVGFIVQWEPPWAVLLGQRGFFDRFTVTMNRFTQALALEPLEVFDDRYGPVIQETSEQEPRFKP